MNLEQLFIGICFWEPSIIYKTKLTPKDFQQQEAKIFQAMKDILQDGNVPDEILVHEKTGIPYTELMDYKKVEFSVMTSNWNYYERQLREIQYKFRLKRELEKLLTSQDSSTDMLISLQELINSLQNESLDFEISNIENTIMDTMKIIDERQKNNKGIIGIPCGLKLDEYTFGFQDRRLYYIGARPSQGKTALLLNFIENCNVCCGVISAESGKEELSMRLLAKGALIDSQRLTVGMLKDGENESLTNSASRLYDKSIFIYDEPNPSIDSVINIATQMKRRYNIKILFVDYLQCLSASSSMLDAPYHQQVAYASKQMKALARRLNIPIVVSAQLRRDAEGNRPQLNDLSDSTQIERDADVVVMIYNKYDKNQNLEGTYLLIEKNRDGRCGDIPVIFNKQYVEFRDM